MIPNDPVMLLSFINLKLRTSMAVWMPSARTWMWTENP